MMNLIIVLTVSITLVSTTYASYDHSIDAAVNSHHSVNTYPVHSSKDPIKSPVVDINSGPLPLTIRFNSHSSHINAIQKHFGRPGQVQKATSVDEPDVLIQNVKKPIIQEVREVITPYRHRTQEVRPVQEKVETIIAKHKDHYGGGHYSSGGDGGGGGGGEGSGDEHYEEHETY